MATKRTQRIDPNAAFNAIIGISPATSTEEKGGGENTALPVSPPAPAKIESDAPFAETAPAETPRSTPATAKAAPTTDNKEDQGAKKLVQKGYYLTEEQVRQLGITAVMNGVDRSSIVREALDLYFSSHTETLP